MERIDIINDEYSAYLYIDNNTYYGYKFNKDNTYEPITKDIFNIFDFVLNDNFDCRAYFQNNGQSIIKYVLGEVESTKKKFNIKNSIVIMSLSALIGVSSLISNPIEVKAAPIPIEEQLGFITLDEVKNKIYSSPNLSFEEKRYLCNEDFINDFLSVINKYNNKKYMFSHYFKNLDIVAYDDNIGSLKWAAGYYDYSIPNKVNIKDYDTLNAINKKTIAHEFIHLCQHSTGYDFLDEASAELIASEYYGYTPIVYLDEIRIFKKLTEIMGREKMFEYIFSQNNNILKEEIAPYLSESEYQVFLSEISHVDREGITYYRYPKLEELIASIYKNKYNDDIKNNKIMNLIDQDNTLVRYYFNSKYINEENSYYYDYDNITLESMSYQEAYERGVLLFEEYFINKDGTYNCTEITYEEYLKIKDDENHHTFMTTLSDFSIDKDNDVVLGKAPHKVYIEPINISNQRTR